MRAGRPSGSAEGVALARAHLDWAGVIEDPYAWGYTDLRWAHVNRGVFCTRARPR